ncbi:MAG: phytanoyl-CoA dioxygenase family protein [Candidatus Latescibacteria bacterium]|nr:phytanoyl-CoA dioxygenase family protein [Candidatus Latescibacterota bacterium]
MNALHPPRLSEEELRQFEEQGFARLGRVVPHAQIEALGQRIDEIMLGRAAIEYERIMMQLDRVAGEDSGPGPQSKGHKGATLAYRKIQDLELDPLFLVYLQQPLFAEICARVYGTGVAIACFRAMFMNKPAGKGTHLVWHQDRWSDLDRDPLITVWTALDPATLANGCVQVVPGSHRALVNPEHPSGFLSAEQAAELLSKTQPVPLELEAGEVVLLHNWLLHSSDVNRTAIPRRAFSVCYMDAATVSSRGAPFPVVFGEGALQPAAAG